MLGLDFLRCVGEAVAAKGLPGLLQQIPFANQLYDIAGDALKRWRARQHQRSLREEIEAVARQEAESLRAVAAELAAEVVPDQPKDVQLSLELYLTQLPGTIRRSLMRADDPTGTTLPAGARIESADDLLPLLPTKPPRFRAGDRPACLDGRWELVELLGAGGFGEVWKGRHVDSPALVSAFKFCLDPQSQDRLLKHEAAVLGQVQKHGKHPGIVPLEDFNLRAETPWLRYEFVPGGDLTRVFADLKPLPTAERVARVVPLLRELAGVVGHFHRLNPAVVHRDLKPANILLAGGSIRVADFGIGNVAASRQLERVAVSTPSLSMALTMRGAHTPLYAGPQQKRGEAPDPRDDVYALGVIGYQLLVADLGAEVSADFDDELRDAGVPNELVSLLKRCVARDPAKRPSDGSEVASLLVVPGGADVVTPAGAAPLLLPGPIAPSPRPSVTPFRPQPPSNLSSADVPESQLLADKKKFLQLGDAIREGLAQVTKARVSPTGVEDPFSVGCGSFIGIGLVTLGALYALNLRWPSPLVPLLILVCVPTVGALVTAAIARANMRTAGLAADQALATAQAAVTAGVEAAQQFRIELAKRYGWEAGPRSLSGEEELNLLPGAIDRLSQLQPRCVEAKIVSRCGPSTVLLDGKVLGTSTLNAPFEFAASTTLGHHILTVEFTGSTIVKSVAFAVEIPGRVLVDVGVTEHSVPFELSAKVREIHG